MTRTIPNLLCITALVILSACTKQPEFIPEDDDSLVTEDLQDEESVEDDDGDIDDDDDDSSPDSQADDEDEGSEPEPPDEEEDPADEAEEEDETADEDTYEDPAGGTYSGDITVIINTTFGPDTCAGSATVDVSCLLYTSPSPRDRQKSRMPSSA